MEAGLMEIVRSLNRSWIYNTYFSLYRAIHPGRNVRGEMSGYRFFDVVQYKWRNMMRCRNMKGISRAVTRRSLGPVVRYPIGTRLNVKYGAVNPQIYEAKVGFISFILSLILIFSFQYSI